MRGDAAWRARGHAAKARACSSQGSPHGQAAKAKAWPHGQAAKAKARSQGQGSPHGQAAKAKACLRACCHGQGQGHGSPHGQAAKAWACSSQGMGMQQPRPRQPLEVFPISARSVLLGLGWCKTGSITTHSMHVVTCSVASFLSTHTHTHTTHTRRHE